MALTNWVGIIAAVKEFGGGRSDLDTAKVDYFIDLAEAYFNNNLRTHEMETTNGSLTATNGVISNPSDFLGWKRLTVSSNGTTQLLSPVSYEQAGMLTDGSTGSPWGYAIRGSSTVLVPTPDSSSYTVAGTYYQKIPALSDTQSTNWISTNYQDAYLYGALAMSEAFTQNDPRLPVWKDLFAESIRGIRKTDRERGQPGVMTTEYPVY